MTKIIKLPNRRNIEEEAALWLVRLDNGAADDERGEDFLNWLKADPHHAEVFESLAVDWGEIAAVSRQKTKVDVAPEAPTQTVVKPVAARRRFLLGISAAALSILVAGVALFALLRDAPAPMEIYATDIGERRDVTLTDGSILRLNTNSQVQVSYAKDHRRLHLVSGEAFFDVVKDAGRSFQVMAGMGQITALGTAFNVRINNGQVHVLITEGRVRIKGENAGADFIAMLKAGQQARYDTHIHSISDVGEADIETTLAWHEGMIIFRDYTLAEAISEINRHTSTRIIIPDSELRQMRVGGYFRLGDTNILLRALADAFDLQLDQVHEGLVYLRRKDTQA